MVHRIKKQSIYRIFNLLQGWTAAHIFKIKFNQISELFIESFKHSLLLWLSSVYISHHVLGLY